MDEYAEVDHLEDCKWIQKNIKKTIRWWTLLGLKSCPHCDGKVNL